MNMYLVTGGAGFVGSNIVRELNDVGIEDIIIVDNIASTDKWMNLRNMKYIEYVQKSRFWRNFQLTKVFKALSIWVHNRQPLKRILIIYGITILNIQRFYGNIAQKSKLVLSMQVLLLHMEMVVRGSVMKWTLMDCCH